MSNFEYQFIDGRHPFVIMRINRFLAQSGVGSRRKVEELIKQGKVRLNSKVITDLATTVDPEKDNVTLDGKTISLPEEKIYIMLNKPEGYVTTAQDTHNRPTVFDLLPQFFPDAKVGTGEKVGREKHGNEMRLFSVGRLDMNSRGLLLLTNDGDWAYELTHPKHKVPKTYEVILNGEPDEKKLEKLRNGIVLEDGKTAPAKGKKIGNKKYQIIIKEGRKRQVRRMFQAIGFEVLDLKRTKLGKYELGNLKEGQFKAVKH